MGDRLPTGSQAPLSSDSTVSGAVQPRQREASFGARVLDLVSESAGNHALHIPPQSRVQLERIIDAGMAQTLELARGMATTGAVSTRWVIRALGIGVVTLAFAIVGVLLWSLGMQIDRTATAVADTQEQLDEISATNTAAAVHRAELDANVKMLAGHAVALTTSVNQTAKANYEMLEVIVNKLGARADVPALHEPPVKIESPIMLRVIAGER